MNTTVNAKMKWCQFCLSTDFIEKNCWTGMQDYFNCLVKALTLESEEAATNITSLKRKTRRKKHINSTDVTMQTHSPDHSSFDHQPPPAIDVSHARNISGTATNICV